MHHETPSPHINIQLTTNATISHLRSVKLKHFQKFEDTTDALAAATAFIEGKLCKSLKKTLKSLVDEDVQQQLCVADAKLGAAIKAKLSIQCVANSGVQELMRCIRSQSESLLAGLPKKEMTAMALGLAHSLSRYKLKFSPDKIDTMIVQAQCLLDDLDKELNNYLMRAREWYANGKLCHNWGCACVSDGSQNVLASPIRGTNAVGFGGAPQNFHMMMTNHGFATIV